MTDEERRHLVSSLRNYRGYDRELTKLVHNAASEIERLVAELEDAKNHDMRDWHDALERGRKSPI